MPWLFIAIAFILWAAFHLKDFMLLIVLGVVVLILFVLWAYPKSKER